MKNLIFLPLFILILASCSKEEMSNTMVNYYFSVVGDEAYEGVSIELTHIRAHQENFGGESGFAYRSVYLQPAQYDINTASCEDDRIFLGESSIEPSRVLGYDLNLGHLIKFRQNGQTQEINLMRNYCNALIRLSNLGITIPANESFNVIFELDLKASTFEEGEKGLTLVPVFNVKTDSGIWKKPCNNTEGK